MRNFLISSINEFIRADFGRCGPNSPVPSCLSTGPMHFPSLNWNVFGELLQRYCMQREVVQVSWHFWILLECPVWWGVNYCDGAVFTFWNYKSLSSSENAERRGKVRIRACYCHQLVIVCFPVCYVGYPVGLTAIAMPVFDSASVCVRRTWSLAE